MRDSRKNKCKELYIGLYHEEETVYEKDEYGNIVYTDIDGEHIPVEAGTKPSGYEIVEEPIMANLAMSGGEAEAVEYGVKTSDYSAKFTTVDKTLPITETSLIWENMPTVDVDNRADGITADWKVVKVSKSQDGVAYLLDKRDK